MPNSCGFAVVVVVAVVVALIGPAAHGQIPPEWQARAAEANMLVSLVEPSDLQLMPYIGNGFLATIVGSNTTYMGGVFNGLDVEGPSHRARIPGTISITVTNAEVQAVAIDLEKGIYYRSLGCDGCAHLQQRFYAHRSLLSLLVCELDIVTTQAVTLSLALNGGAPSADVNLSPSPNSTKAMTVMTGSTLIAELPGGELIDIALAFTPVPSSLYVPAGTNASYVSACAVLLASVRVGLGGADQTRAAGLCMAWLSGSSSSQHIIRLWTAPCLSSTPWRRTSTPWPIRRRWRRCMRAPGKMFGDRA